MLKNLTSLVIICLCIFLAFHFESATKVKSKASNGFSADNAYEHLKQIAKKPHPIGSLENQNVRDYIVSEFTKLGLNVEIQSGYTRSSWKPSYMKMAYVENVIATLKGTDPNAKKVVISCHYDSVIEGPGAADDGYAVAAAIESAKLLKTENRKSDIIFLITDGEEYGLLGAQYYAEHTDISNIGVMLNYEARGNEGPGIAFELSENNSWLIDELSASYNRPIANSLSFEVYKRMGNGSDFTIFKRKGIPGINHAFIDGFSYYHHPQDNINNISKESIQHTGENMYLAAKHFSNYQFKEEAKRNASYFNFYGFFINYGSDLDLIIFSLANIFFIILLMRRKKNPEYSNKKTLIGFLYLLGTLLLCVGLCFGLSQLVKYLYPQYSTFYAYHYYNHEWYLLSGIGVTLITTYFLGKKLLNKLGTANLGISFTLFLIILSFSLYVYATSATYVMLFPLIITTIGLYSKDLLKQNEQHWKSQFIGTACLVLLIGFWGVFSHSLYLAFSLSILAAAIIPTVLFCFASYALLPDLWSSSKAIAILGSLLAIISLSIAHIQSKSTEERPLKSNLFYTYKSETNKTYVATYDDYINEGHLGKLDPNNNKDLGRNMPYSTFANESDQSLTKYLSVMTTIVVDTVKRSKTIALKRPFSATRINLIIPDISNIDSLFIDNQLNKSFKPNANGRFFSPLYGIGLDSMNIRVVSRKNGVKSKIYVNTHYIDFPEKETLPPYIVRNGGKVVMSEHLEF